MKLPEKIKGRNRIRDGAIVLYFKRDTMDYYELSEKFKLGERRILQILSKNHAFIKVDKDWEKEKRINRLQRWIKYAPKPEANALTLQQELRREIEGEEGGQKSGDSKIVIIYPPGFKKEELNESRTERISSVVSK